MQARTNLNSCACAGSNRVVRGRTRVQRFSAEAKRAMQIHDAQPTAIPNAVIALALSSTLLCTAKKAPAGRYPTPNVTSPFIDHSNEMWNFSLR